MFYTIKKSSKRRQRYTLNWEYCHQRESANFDWINDAKLNLGLIQTKYIGDTMVLKETVW